MTNEHDASKSGRDVPMHEHGTANEAQITLHEKLCAYILGEADDDERAEVERALENSAELRAERERLELTIGFVRDALTDVEKLSPQATADVLSAAGAKKPRPWYFSTPIRIAAGIAAVTLAYAVFENGREEHVRVDGRVARLDGLASRSRGNEPDRDQPWNKTQAGVADGTAQNSERAANATPASSPTANEVSPSRAESAKLAAAEPRAGEAHQLTDGLESKADHSSLTPPAERELLAKKIAEFNPSVDSPHASGARAVPAAPIMGQLGLESIRKRESTSDSKHADEQGGSIDRTPPDNRVADNSTQSSAIGVGRAGRAGSAGAGPSSLGPSGPSSPGPSGASTGGTSVSSESRRGTSFGARSLGKGRAAAPANEPQALKGLGYSGNSDAAAKDNLADSAHRLKELGYVGDSDANGEARPSEVLTGGDDYYLGSGQLQRKAVSRPVTPEERDALVEKQCRLILERCHRQPNERPRDMYFRFWGDNAFQIAALEAQSTFSVDVDTASYALARRYLNEGTLPEKAQVRTEEFINYFKPDVAPPREGTFAIQTELAPSRFSNDAGRTMLRVAVRGREVTKQERKPLALTFVIDCSGSMQEQGRLEMVKHAIRLLLNQLDANDSIAIVVFSSDARLILPMTSAARRDLIESALFPLKPENSTNSEAGLRMGFEAALAGINANANNRVVFLSDGVANVGETDPERLAEGVKKIREKGIYLNSIGVGMNNHNDTLLEQLADKGDGVCNYIDSLDEAKRVMVDNFTGAMETIARDVKIQVEFDPAQVYRYRLLGYENRFIANQDFRNDKVDAGEVGAGHQVCALYELELANTSAQAAALAGKAADAAAQKPLATVRLRWKAPRDVRRPDANEEATEIAKPVLASQMTSYEGASFGYKRAVVVAQFAEFLRRSTHARGRSFDELLSEAKKLEKQSEDKDFSELVTLLEKSRSLILANLPQCDELCQTIDIVRRNQILRAEHDMLSVERDQKALDELARQNAELEARIRELLRRKLEEKTK